MPNPSVLEEPRPWAFSQAELTAGLRAASGDKQLKITGIEEIDMPERLPSLGRIRGLRVIAIGASEPQTFDLALKEPQGITRLGTAGAGRREVNFYTNLTDQLTIHVPKLMAASPTGEWLALELLNGGRPPDQWQRGDVLSAVDTLLTLQDRFWGLGEDLKAYPWLARSLDADFDIYQMAASASVQRILDSEAASPLNQDIDLMLALKRLLNGSEKIASCLMKLPPTLIHGDYWPGNIYLYPDGRMVVYDWQMAGIGPGILDLFTFIHKTAWWFNVLPAPPSEIIRRYRQGILERTGCNWTDAEWWSYWDYALLWTFLTSWIDLLANIPTSVLKTSYHRLEKLWLDPLKAAANRRLL